MPGGQRFDVRVWEGRLTPAMGGTGEIGCLLDLFLDQVGRRIRAGYEVLLREDLPRTGPPRDAWLGEATFADPFDRTPLRIQLYLLRERRLWRIVKLLSALDDEHISEPLGRSAVFVAANWAVPAGAPVEVLITSGVLRTDRPSVAAGLRVALDCVCDYIGSHELAFERASGG